MTVNTYDNTILQKITHLEQPFVYSTGTITLPHKLPVSEALPFHFWVFLCAQHFSTKPKLLSTIAHSLRQKAFGLLANLFPESPEDFAVQKLRLI